MTPKTFLISLIQLNPKSPDPLYMQIYHSVRKAILEAHLAQGTKLPSTRDLAALLDVSRNTVLNAVDQLIAEGYLETREKSGTYVTSHLPEAWLNATHPTQINGTDSPQQRRISQQGERMSRTRPHQQRQGNKHNWFTNGIPALELFPFEQWGKFTMQVYRNAPLELFDETVHPAGYEPLREQITEYLRTARALNCQPEQVIMVSGSQQGFYITAAMLLNPGDKVWMEEPGCMGPRAAFLSQGAQLIPVPVDNEGLNVDAGIAAAPDAPLIYVNPSRQYPLSKTLSLARRSQALEWAHHSGAWIMEDDYDSEFRYVGRPLASLQGMDTHQRVIYIGTFSKVLFPALRLGYMVVPPDLVDVFTAARAAIEKYPPIVNQVVLHRFMAEGHFHRHIRRMRNIYDERRALFVAALESELGGLIRFDPPDAGMHICALLPDALNDVDIARRAIKVGVELLPLSEFYIGEKPQNGLILGYTAIQPEYIRPGVHQLAKVMTKQIVESPSSIADS